MFWVNLLESYLFALFVALYALEIRLSLSVSESVAKVVPNIADSRRDNLLFIFSFANVRLNKAFSTFAKLVGLAFFELYAS